MTSEIDTFLTEQIVCPYCGHKNCDSDYTNDRYWICENCEEDFLVEASYSVLYITRKE